MADTKVSELSALTGANLADDDLVSVVDISDTTMAASGTNKKMTVTEFAVGVQDELSIANTQVTGLGGAAVLNVGATTGTVCAGDDARLSNARTPTAHKTSHATGGSDALTAADIGAAASSHNHAASEITSGTIASARLGSGGAGGGTKFLADDQTFKTVVTTSAGSDLYLWANYR